MRRQDIVEGIDKVTRALEVARVPQLAQSLVEGIQDGGRGRNEARAESSPSILSSMKSFFLVEQSFGEVEKSILEITELQGLSDVAFWESLIDEDVDPQARYSFYRRVSFALNELQIFKKLINQETVDVVRKESKDKTSQYFGKDILSVLVIEEDEAYSKPERLAHVLESIALFYEVCATINNAPNHELSVLACDSGSDKSFDFLGAAKVIECIKEVVLSLWDRVVFYRERQLTARLELVTQALPIIEQIGELENSNKLPPEQAEMLRRKVVDGATKFISSGAVIPEIEASTVFKPRELMAPEKKYLMPPSSLSAATETEAASAQASQNDGANEIGSLSPKEQAQLLELLRKAKRVEESDLDDVGSES